MNKDIMKKAGFGKEVKAIEEKRCPLCKQKINMREFRDSLSEKECGISGMCQNCQDDFFGK